MSEISYSIAASIKREWKSHPFEHTYLLDVFPDEIYEEMIKSLPADDKYQQYNKIYKNRFINPCNKGIWAEVNLAMRDLFENETRIQLLRDFPGYSIGPHTDGKREEFTFLFYLTDKVLPDSGTVIYEPVTEGFTCDGTRHHTVDKFKMLERIEFAPNTGFGFKRSDNSFHGVEECDYIRNLIQLSVYK